MESKIKKVDWVRLVNRKESLLFESLVDNCYKYGKITGLKTNIVFSSHSSSGDVLHSQKEINNLSDEFKKADFKKLYKFKELLKRTVEHLNEIGKIIEKLDFSKLTQAQIKGTFEKFYEAALQANCFLAPMPVADKVLSARILELLPSASMEQKQEWLSALTYPQRESSHTLEERDFLKLSQEKGQQRLEKLIKIHLKKYAWIGARWYWWENAWTEENIKNRLNDLLANKKNSRKELNYLDKLRSDKKGETLKLIKALKIKKNSEIYGLIKLAQEFAYLRTWRTDLIYRAGYLSRNLFYKLLEDTVFNKNDVQYLTILEYKRLAEKKTLNIKPKQIRERKKFYLTAMIASGYYVLAGRKAKEIKLIKENKINKSEIMGNVAYPGKAKGKVKLVLTAEDISKVKRGDILVAIMTFPHFISAMEKAAAFITDEGGILCHAAIIAREMRKPCIIGTKNATKILKDGDLINVDANKGLIKIK